MEPGGIFLQRHHHQGIEVHRKLQMNDLVYTLILVPMDLLHIIDEFQLFIGRGDHSERHRAWNEVGVDYTLTSKFRCNVHMFANI
jgi:hypothetical protein